ncbi:MAG: sigma 54-interacting transcriptional regulator [Syntrophaceae bacterium]|nr:sigma 54-interacting transcriptional regulator [Syntrophaceae bacterium]
MLRFRQEREFRRVGGNQVLHSDVRIITATNRDPRPGSGTASSGVTPLYRLNVVICTSCRCGNARRMSPP